MRVVYIDSLFLVNFLTDYFLLKLTATVGGLYPQTKGLLLGALTGALTAVILFFLPLPVWLGMIARAGVCVLTTLAAFGKLPWYPWLRLNSLFLVLTMLLAGVVLGLALYTDHALMQNGVPYFEVSIPMLVAGCLLLLLLARLVFGKGRAQVKRSYREVTVIKNKRQIIFRALTDSGNLLQDPISGKRVLVVHPQTLSRLFDGAASLLLQNLPAVLCERDLERLHRCCRTAFWLIPVHTAVQNGMMPVFRPDRLLLDGRDSDEYVIGLASASMEIGGDCQAVIGV